MVWFGCLSFVLVVAKEELLRLALRSRLAQAQYRRRFILVGAQEELARTRRIGSGGGRGVEYWGSWTSRTRRSRAWSRCCTSTRSTASSSAPRRAYFEPVEAVIRACELEGVEVWLVADFFKTQISRTSLDDFYGRPVLVFRSAPEASWQGVAKQVLDYVLALAAARGALAPLLALVGAAHQADLARAGPVPAAALRPQRPALHDVQVPHDGHQRRAAQT